MSEVTPDSDLSTPEPDEFVRVERDEARAEVERLRNLNEFAAGSPTARLRAVFEFAEQELGHDGFSALDALTTIRSKVAALKAEVERLPSNRPLYLWQHATNPLLIRSPMPDHEDCGNKCACYERGVEDQLEATINWKWEEGVLKDDDDGNGGGE